MNYSVNRQLEANTGEGILGTALLVILHLKRSKKRSGQNQEREDRVLEVGVLMGIKNRRGRKYGWNLQRVHTTSMHAYSLHKG